MMKRIFLIHFGGNLFMDLIQKGIKVFGHQILIPLEKLGDAEATLDYLRYAEAKCGSFEGKTSGNKTYQIYVLSIS